MKIAHVLSSLHTGGAERVALLVAERLVARGHQVTLVSLEEFPDGRLRREFEAADVRVELIEKRKGGFDRTLSARLLRYFWHERFGVVHTHNPLPLIYAALPGRLSGARALHTKHGPHPDSFARLMLRRVGAASTNAFVAVSEATADYAREIWEVDSRKLHVVTNGTDTERFQQNQELRRATREQLGIPADAHVVGTVGRMAPVKNQALLVRAAAPLLGPLSRLVIVGDGALSAQTQELARSLRVSDFVHFPGETSEVPAYLASFDVFALSSDSEGLPLSLTEAMSVELPLVCTRVGGVPKLVDDGETGLLVEAQDEQGLRAALRRLQDDPPFARLLGKRGREVALARYSAERMVDEYVALYGG